MRLGRVLKKVASKVGKLGKPPAGVGRPQVGGKAGGLVRKAVKRPAVGTGKRGRAY